MLRRVDFTIPFQRQLAESSCRCSPCDPSKGWWTNRESGFPASYRLTRTWSVPLNPASNPPTSRQGSVLAKHHMGWDPHSPARAGHLEPIARAQPAPRIPAVRCLPTLLTFPLPCRRLPSCSLQGSDDQQHSFPLPTSSGSVCSARGLCCEVSFFLPRKLV